MCARPGKQQARPRIDGEKAHGPRPTTFLTRIAFFLTRIPKPPPRIESSKPSPSSLDWWVYELLGRSRDPREVTLQVTVCTAPPPLVSYICVWSPSTDPAQLFAREPEVEAVNADLVFLRVHGRRRVEDLVFQARGPSLTLLPDPAGPYLYLRERDRSDLHNNGLLPSCRAGAVGFCVCSLLPNLDNGVGHYNLCLFDSMDGKWSHEPLCLDQLRNAPDKDTILHSTQKVIILDDEKVGFVDLWRGMVICNVLAGGKPGGSYVLLPPELINLYRTCDSLICRDIAIVNGRLTVVRMRMWLDSDTDCWSWDLSTWSKAMTSLDEEDWHEDFMIKSHDVSVDDDTLNVGFLPILNDRPTIARLQSFAPTLILTDAHIVYLMGKVDGSDEKAVVLTIDVANKRIKEVSVYDAERIINDFDVCYTQSTISQYFTTTSGLQAAVKET